MIEPVITVESVGKMYPIRHQQAARYGTLREAVSGRLSAPFRSRPAKMPAAVRSNGDAGNGNLGSTFSTPTEEFWALRDVSFEVTPGEVIGIVGRNGAGKSTLLKLLSQITEPTQGRIRLRGRVASLLEVGTGFHPELTGRENIFLNGAILGMSHSEVRQKFDEIVAFAEVEQFLDTPVKRYSSGMYVRLAFAVAAHLEPEILVVDEVLAVGDAQFQKKCLGRMDSVAQSGRTVLFVSHNMASIQRLCSRGLFLRTGTLVEDGPIASVVGLYHALEESPDSNVFNPTQRSGEGWARVTGMRMVEEDGTSAETTTSDADLLIELDISLAGGAVSGRSLRGLVLELMFFNQQGQPVTSVMNLDDPGVQLPDAAECRIRMRLPGPTFVPGRYHVNVFLGTPYVQHVDELREALVFDVRPPIEAWRPYDLSEIRGNACRKAQWIVSTAGYAGEETPTKSSDGAATLNPQDSPNRIPR